MRHNREPSRPIAQWIERLLVTLIVMASVAPALRLLVAPKYESVRSRATRSDSIEPWLQTMLRDAPPDWLSGLSAVVVGVLALSLVWRATPSRHARALWWFLALLPLHGGQLAHLELIPSVNTLLAEHHIEARTAVMWVQSFVVITPLAGWTLLLLFVQGIALLPAASPTRSQTGDRPSNNLLALALVAWGSLLSFGLANVPGRSAGAVAILAIGVISWLMAERAVALRNQLGEPRQAAQRARTFLGWLGGTDDAPRILIVALGMLFATDAWLALRFLDAVDAGRDWIGLAYFIALPTLVMLAQMTRRSWLVVVMPLTAVASFAGGLFEREADQPSLAAQFGVSLYPVDACIAALVGVGSVLAFKRVLPNKQLFWILLGLLLALALDLTRLARIAMLGPAQECDAGLLCAVRGFELWLPPIRAMLLAVFLSFGLTKQGSIDASRVFNRSTLVVVLSTCLIVGFHLVEHWLSDKLGNWLSAGQVNAASLAVTALILLPLKHYVEHWIHRLFPVSRADAH